MFNSIFIFITLSFIVLVGVAFILRIPRAGMPLGIVYIIFIFMNNDSTDKTNHPVKDQQTSHQNDQTLKQEKHSVSKPVQPLQNFITPKSLKFESGRTQKDLLSVKKEEVTEENDSESIVKKQIEQLKEPQPLSLRDIQFCKSVKNRNPVGADVYFSKYVDSLYCYTRIQNPGKKQEVKHKWYFEDKLMTQIRYNIKKSNTYRSWTRKTIRPYQVGKWRVDVLDASGSIIGSKNFEITK